MLFIVIRYGIIIIKDIMQLALKEELSLFLNQYVKILQNLLFFGAFMSIFIALKKSFVFSIPLSFFEVNNNILSTKIYPLLFNENSGISSEYIRIFLFLVILLIFVYKVFSRTKKIENIFLLLSMIGVLGTAVLFHTMTIKQLDYYTLKQQEIWNKSFNNGNLNDMCKVEELICEKIINEDKIDKEYIKNYYIQFKPHMEKYNDYFYYIIAFDNKIQSRIFSRKPLAFVKYEGNHYYILDDNKYTNYLKFNEKIFGILAMSSHIVWIFGALFLIYFHKKRIYKNKTINTESNIG